MAPTGSQQWTTAWSAVEGGSVRGRRRCIRRHVDRAVIRAEPSRAADPCSGAVTVVGDLQRGLAAATAAAADRYVNVPGADIARQCLEAGALDEVLTIIAPVLLGDGTGCSTQVPHATNLWMRVLR